MLLRFLLSDPAMHWGVFAVLSGLLCVGFCRSLYSHFVPYRAGPDTLSYRAGRNKKQEASTQHPAPSNQLPVILLGIGYVLFIEIYQAVLPWRSFGFDDILWGSVGVVSVAILAGLINK